MLERKAVIEARKEYLESLHVKRASILLLFSWVTHLFSNDDDDDDNIIKCRPDSSKRTTKWGHYLHDHT